MPLLNLFWTMLMFFLFFAWIWIVITVYIDIFRSDDLSGFFKAVWIVFVLILPWLGVLIYLIARGGKMQERQIKDAADQQAAFKSYVQDAAGTGASTADELEKLGKLKDSGVITDEEFSSQKAKLLS